MRCTFYAGSFLFSSIMQLGASRLRKLFGMSRWWCGPRPLQLPLAPDEAPEQLAFLMPSNSWICASWALNSLDRISCSRLAAALPPSRRSE